MLAEKEVYVGGLILIIYILRHGTTEWNREHRIQGATDIMLDSTGREMAYQTGKKIAELGINFNKVYSSPLKRAYETAELVSGIKNKDGEESGIIVDSRLRELCFGRQEGQKVEGMMYDVSVPFRYFKSAPDKYDELTENDDDIESLTALCRRAGEFLAEKIENVKHGSEDNILISGHGALNKALLMHIRGTDNMPDFWGSGLQPNCGIDIARYDEVSGRYEIIAENKTFYDSNLKDRITQLL